MGILHPGENVNEKNIKFFQTKAKRIHLKLTYAISNNFLKIKKKTMPTENLNLYKEMKSTRGMHPCKISSIYPFKNMI